MKVLPGAEEGEKPTEEGNKRVAEVLVQQQQPESTRKPLTRARHRDMCEDWKVRFGQRDDYGFYLILV